MKSLIVYYSLNGNTDFAARRIADATGADLLRLYPQKAYPDSGIKKFLWGGKSAVMAERPALQPYTFDGAAYGRIIFGTPVWASNYAPPIRTFLGDNAAALKDKRFAAFICYAGGGADKTLEKLRADLGAEAFDATAILTDPKDKPTPGNEKKLDAFIAELEKGETPAAQEQKEEEPT